MPNRGRHTERKKTQGLYDRIADVHNLALKVNGYRASVSKYLRSLKLNIGPDSEVLDAGSGTGIITLAAQDAGFLPRNLVSLDLSIRSLKVLNDQVRKRKKHRSYTHAIQGNILHMPFADETFDLVLTCGVLEYTPLEEGLCELARVTRRGCRLILLPVRPSLVGSVLEVLYNFKAHRPAEVRAVAEQYFNILDHRKFPITEPISWSKTVFLLERK